MKLWIGTVSLLVLPSRAFVSPATTPGRVIPHQRRDMIGVESASALKARTGEKDGDQEAPSYLLQEFAIASGEVINPYDVLKCSRAATRQEIRSSYIDLSRRYHPDAMKKYRANGILPGSCNNLEEVREHWERIKFAYEILTDSKLRKRYDRHEALADPGEAVKRAAVDAAIKGVSGLGRGIFDMGSFAVKHLTTNNNKTENKIQDA